MQETGPHTSLENLGSCPQDCSQSFTEHTALNHQCGGIVPLICVCAMVQSPEGLTSQCSSGAFPLLLGWAFGANHYGMPPSSREVVHSSILTLPILSAGFQLSG